MTDRLASKTLVIIGGTSGIGLAAAHAFLREGANVVAVGLRHDACDLHSSTSPVRVIEADAREPNTADDAVRIARETFGAFHGLYHVAGGSGRRFGDGPLHDLTEEAWDETLRLNLTSVFHSNRAAVRALRDAGHGGAILNVSSALAFAPAPDHFATCAYATAKAAIIGLTTWAAAFYAKDNIRVNALAPGLVDTPMAQRALGDDAIMRYVRARQPLDGGRAALPSDLAEAAVLLLSDAARFITGQVLAIDGGWSVSDGV
jgi:NAD(P)-dependent dehydrogenase (short-subunit alcohol dehydrogenase family)